MVAMQQTSRHYIFDAIEFCVNQIQLASHLQELIDYDYSDLQIEDDDKRPPIEQRMFVNKMLLDDAIAMRRDMMTKIQ